MKAYKIRGISTTIVLFLALGFLLLSANLAYPDISYQEGWPQEVEGGVSAPIIAGDLDADGDLEIIACSGLSSVEYKIYVWHDDGSLLSGWPKGMPRISGSLCVGDLDGDGDLEIVAATFKEPDGPKVYAFHHDGTLVDGWPQTARANRYIFGASPTLGDVDGDGDLEILIPTDFGFIHVWHHDGTLLPGWGEIQEYPFVYSSLTLADVDKDGDLEIFSTSLWGPEGRVWGLHHDDKDGNGRIDRVHGWPSNWLEAHNSDVVIGDIDNDEDFEVLSRVGNKIYAWHVEDWDEDGKADPIDGWPQDTGVPMKNPVLADLDGDKDLEIISASSEGTVYIWHHDGSSFNGWPKENIGYPVIGEVDSDNQVEIIAVDAISRTEIYAYNLDGSLVDGWPLQGEGTLSGILLADIDSDNDLEILSGGNKVYIWDSPEKYNAAFIEWVGYQHDRYNSGLHGHKIALEVPNDKGYKRVQTAIDAAQAGDFVKVDALRYPPILPRGNKKANSKPSNVNLKSGIDIIWSIE